MSDPILRDFLAETEDLLEILFGDLQALRLHHAEGRARRELIGRIFRHVHTIKGSSATVELNTMMRIAHDFESVLDSVRLGRLKIDEPVLNAFDDAAALLTQSLERTARGEAQPDVQALIERLRRLARPEPDEKRTPSVRRVLAALPEGIARSLSEHEAHRLLESIGEGGRVFVVAINFDLATFDERFRSLSDALTEEGEIVSTLPGLEGMSPDQIGFRIVHTTKASREELAARVLPFGQATVTELSTAIADETRPDGAVVEANLAENTPPRTIAPVTTRMRIELQELDQAISATHAVLAETTDTLNLATSGDQQTVERTELAERLTGIRRQLAELEEQLIALRMVPVAQMLERAARAGRITARVTGKQVDFETEGGPVRLDKALADAMADPLLHILRNAVDHGIETSAERATAGKNPRGRVSLGAWTAGSRVVLKVADDGRGIDPLHVSRAAAGQGIIDAGKVLTKEQAMRLIFRPGFSTASSVSNVSGRGVGLDVVERAIELVGGKLRVSSEQGAGTLFEMILPTTVALTAVRVVSSAGYRYCIDERHIEETGFVAEGDIESSGGAEHVRWGGALVPLVRMRQLLALPPREEANGENLPVLIFSVGRDAEADATRHGALAVDAVGERGEALVRGLGRHAARWRGISGATELPDGAVALVLDLEQMLDMGRQLS